VIPEDHDFERRLERLFDDTRAPLAGEAFRTEIERRLRIVRRGSLAGQLVVYVLLACGLAAATPLIVHETLRLSGSLSEAISGIGNALLAPAGGMAAVLFASWAMRRWRLPGR
jgi:hypothetical protein